MHLLIEKNHYFPFSLAK
ncbi:hypothetical protein EE612_046653 [Oryza sativa]|nr:hypothetical protein EE612_046653 [Oryza sativa]